MPVYQDATYGGETEVLENAHLRLELHKRVSGWGWGEVFTPAGRMMAVLEHLGEVKLQGLPFPLRMEASGGERETGAFGQQLRFKVKSMVIHDMVQGTSFERWVKWPIEKPVMEGTVTFVLEPDAPILRLIYEFKSLAILSVSYLRGPWLKIGADSFGAAKEDGIFPGVEWLIGDEWSSGTDWFRDPWALRVAPHPYKVAAPVMALSYDGTGIGMAWNPLAPCMSHRRYPQPVYASPNFVDRRNNHVMGLMVPSATRDTQENSVSADPPLVIRANGAVRFEAEVFLVVGNSLDVLVDWVKRRGLPEVPKPRYPLSEALDRIARAYNSNLWHEGKGWGGGPWAKPSPAKPMFVERYIAEGRDRGAANGLAQKLAWARKQPDYAAGNRDATRFERWEPAQRLAYGRELLGVQKEDGSFAFDPDGRHYVKDDVVFARVSVQPLGMPGDTALDLCVVPAIELLRLADLTGDDSFREGARRALDFCLPMERPEGGDYWETPIHSPNLLAAGHAAIAYNLGYQAFDESRYLDKAIHWIRALLPFTHLWEPSDRPMVYNTKPCLCASDWYLANRLQSHVQWEVLLTFALSAQVGIDWGQVDSGIDWHRYQKGITVAAMRWMIDHKDVEGSSTFPRDLVESGALDTLFADAHDTTTGVYGGGPIMADPIAVNLQDLLDREGG